MRLIGSPAGVQLQVRNAYTALQGPPANSTEEVREQAVTAEKSGNPGHEARENKARESARTLNVFQQEKSVHTTPGIGKFLC